MLHKPGIMAVAAFLRMQALSARATVGRASGPVTGTVIDTASDPVAGAVAGIARALSPGQLPVWLRALSAGTIVRRASGIVARATVGAIPGTIYG
jgi:hypothetical protein